MNSVTILGLRVDCISPKQALDTLEGFIAARTPRHVVTADSSMAVLARHDPELRALVAGADLVTPDGYGLLWASRLLGTPIQDKVSGVDLAAELCRLSAVKGYRLFFLGAAPGVAAEAAANMSRRFPGAQIVGARDGFFSAEQEPEVVAQIQAAAPDVLLVAFGIPKQEKWIARHKTALQVAVLIGVGGTLDVFSGRVKRAPLWMQNHGWEWLYRLWTNPKKISKVMALPQFAFLAIRQRFLGAV